MLGRIQRLRKLKAQYETPDRERFTELRAKPLGKFIPALSPDYREPLHLAPLLGELEGLFNGRKRLCVSVPPRHGKSDTILHFIAWLLLRFPKARILYVTHTSTFAKKQSKTARRLARLAGVRLSDESNRADEWETEQGGGLTARGIDGDITGRGFDVILVDDPVKNRAVAESAIQREAIFEWFTNDVFTRLTPTGSVVVVHTRWHVGDLIGRLTKEKGYRRLNLRAIAVVGNDNGRPDNDNWRDPRADGDPLWPAGGWTAEVLDERRRLVGEYAWWSLYQGEPRPRGGAVFEEPRYYDELPSKAYRVAYGIDLAYSKKTTADWSVCVELWREDRGLDANGNKQLPLFYVVDVVRKQVKAPEFVLALHAKQSLRRAPMRWYAAGPEIGVGDFIQRHVRGLDIQSATGDKFIRAQPVAAAWNDGRILVPSWKALDLDDEHETLPDWLVCFLDEVAGFTGVNDLHDDQVDAFAAAFDVLNVQALDLPTQPPTPDTRWGDNEGRGYG